MYLSCTELPVTIAVDTNISILFYYQMSADLSFLNDPFKWNLMENIENLSLLAHIRI